MHLNKYYYHFIKGKFASIQMFNALSFNYYYLGNKEQSKVFWEKLLQISKVDVGYAPWVLEESKQTFDQKYYHCY